MSQNWVLKKIAARKILRAAIFVKEEENEGGHPSRKTIPPGAPSR